MSRDYSLTERFETLTNNRSEKLERARGVAEMTLPSLLPPDGFSQNNSLVEPFSSVPARGVTSMAARMLSAMLPLNDAPFFRFEDKGGDTYSVDTEMYLERLAQQTNRALISGNLRDQLFLALQHLIVVGDVMIMMDDTFDFSIKRLDEYVVRRDVTGKLIAVIYIEWKALDPDAPNTTLENTWTTSSSAPGQRRPEYVPVYCRSTFDHDSGVWMYEKEMDDQIVETGEYTVPPFAVLRWSGLVGEDYGRSHCEEMVGDLRSLESYTQSLIEGMAASSRFYMAVSGSGTTDIDDLTTAQNGDWIQARQEDVFVLSPSSTMKPATQAAMEAVNTLRSEVSRAFLMAQGTVRQAE